MKLRYTVPALTDVDAIVAQIAANTPQGAERVQAVIDLLLLYPFIGVQTGDPVVRRMTTRPFVTVTMGR